MLDGVITQNVDTLHRKAGTEELVEVHGSIATCSCSACGEREALASVRGRASPGTPTACPAAPPARRR